MEMRPTAGPGARDLLQSIYEQRAVSKIEAAIDERLDHYKRQLGPSVQASGLSERDVMLITYGDSLNDGDAPPLEVLRRFYSQHLSGVFSLVHILPFHPYSSDDGFSVIDFFAVREDLGTWSDIRAIARECRVMADAVINHVSSQSAWFRAYLDGEPAYADFFVDCDPDTDLSSVVRPRTSPLLSEYRAVDGQAKHIWTTFSADQVDLNYANPDVLIAVIDVLFWLIANGARLLRLDAVTFLWKEPGSSSANLPQTHALIKVLRAAVTRLCEDVVVITETNVPHRENIAYFGDGHDEAHMVYNFALPPLVAHSFVEGDARSLSRWAAGLSLPSDEVCFLNFSASHDGVGVRPVEEILSEQQLSRLVDSAKAAGGQVSYRSIGGEERPYELNCTFLDLISRPGEAEAVTAARFVASQAIVLAMPGVPAIYIQSLLGTRNDLALAKTTGRARSVNRSKLEIADIERDLGDAASLRSRIFSALKAMLDVRRREPAFCPFGGFEVLELDDRVFAIRRDASDHHVITAVNVTGGDIEVRLDGTATGKNLLSGESMGADTIHLAAYAVVWLRMDTAK